MLGSIFHFSQIYLSILFANLEDLNQTPHHSVSDLGLHYLPMTNKNDARLIWVNLFYSYFHICTKFTMYYLVRLKI